MGSKHSHHKLPPASTPKKASTKASNKIFVQDSSAPSTSSTEQPSSSTESSSSSSNNLDIFSLKDGNILEQIDAANEEYLKKHNQLVWEKEQEKKKEEEAKEQERKKKKQKEKRKIKKTVKNIERQLAEKIEQRFKENGYHIEYPISLLIVIPQECKYGFESGNGVKIDGESWKLDKIWESKNKKEVVLYQYQYGKNKNKFGQTVLELLKKKEYDVKCVTSQASQYDSSSESSDSDSCDYYYGCSAEWYLFIKDKPKN